MSDSDLIVFYSWQSDSPGKDNKYFIRDALKEALKRIVKNPLIIEDPRIDQDTKNIPGFVDITNTIFEKIRKCDIFVCDLTGVYSNEKEIRPNSNVLIELGYALNSITDKCIIPVMNTSYGNPEKLEMPFDLRHKRWPISYSITPNDNYKVIKNKLTDNLEIALMAVIKERDKRASEISVGAKLPSYEGVFEVIKRSDENNDWEGISGPTGDSRLYKMDVNLRMEMLHSDAGIQNKDFHEDWANNHPNRHAIGYWCDIYYGTTLVGRRILVSVDGGRCLLPLPKFGKMYEEYKVVPYINYKIAKIFDTIGDISNYMNRCKFIVDKDDEA